MLGIRIESVRPLCFCDYSSTGFSKGRAEFERVKGLAAGGYPIAEGSMICVERERAWREALRRSSY